MYVADPVSPSIYKASGKSSGRGFRQGFPYMEFQRNPKGYPLQNVKNFNEILRGTPCKMQGISMKS
jgi:hypothetical protein